ncbi:N-acetylmuramoyl-L-alanine amidase, partial [bacterium]|nr:N-acetylmuramoyl-L-alanine amidase [bacterium]
RYICGILRLATFVVFLFLYVFCSNFLYAINTTSYKYGGVNIRNVVDKGISYLAIEDMKQLFDLKVKYFPFTKILAVTKDSTVFKFVVNTKTVFINSELTAINAAPRIFEGELYLPLKFLKIHWLAIDKKEINEIPVKSDTSIDQQIRELSFQDNHFSSTESKTGYKTNREIVIILDAGHGGKDPGTVFKKIYEKHINLKITKKLKQYFSDDAGFKVIMVRNNDKFINLDERTFFANSNHGDLFISIHINASFSNKSKGIEIFIPTRTEKDVGNISKKEMGKVAKAKQNIEADIRDLKQDIIYIESKNLAVTVKDSIVNSDIGMDFRSIKKSRFCIFSNIDMPSILLEVGFITCKSDREYLNSDENIDLIAKKIFHGVRNYYENQ